MKPEASRLFGKRDEPAAVLASLLDAWPWHVDFPAFARDRSVSFLHGSLWPHRTWLLSRDDGPQTQKRHARHQQGRSFSNG